MILLFAALALVVPTHAAFACPAAFVHDGDYIRCQGGPAMRLAAIDAPDFTDAPRCRPRPKRGAVCDDDRARAARDNLRRLVAAGPLRCRRVDASPFLPGFQAADRYGRPVVRCEGRQGDIGQAQIDGGFATVWPPARHSQATPSPSRSSRRL